jgi:hypothetical protein
MRIIAGEVTKEIPKEYALGLKLVKPSMFDKPDKIRPSNLERFLFAEAAWRVKLAETDPLVYEYISHNDSFPVRAEVQVNRKNERRHLVVYSNKVVAITPRTVVDLFPNTKWVNVDW